MTSPPSPLSEGLDPPLHIIRWYFWNDIPRPLKTKSSKLLFKKAIFQFFFGNTEIFLSIKYFALGFTDNVAVVVISVCVYVL